MRRAATALSLLAMMMVLLLGLLPSVAAAGTTNPDCLTCHGGGTLWDQDFNVGPVDKATACGKCHLGRFAGTHPYHNAGGNCKVCHTSYGPSLLANVPTGVYAYGAFASAASGDTTSSILHIIHTNPRWPAGVSTDSSKCASCHGIAACDACHAQPIAAAHADHGNEVTSTPIGTWTGNVSPGVVAGNDTVNTMQHSRSIKCGASGCHDIPGTAARRAIFFEDRTFPAYPADGYPLPTTIETSATWRVVGGGDYTKGAESVSNVANNRMKLIFSGTKVEVLGSRDPYRGQAEIFIDGVSQGTIDLYNPTTTPQMVLWSSSLLTNSSHYIQIRVTGLKHANARAAYVSVDQFRVYTTPPGSIAPTCVSCHDGSHAGTGTPPPSVSFTHDATQTITGSNFYNTGYGNYACNQCHATKMRDEHNRTTSSGPRSCSTCHNAWAPQTWTATWVATDGCNYGTCHPTSGEPTRTPHAQSNAAHLVPALRADDACRDCHGADLRGQHNNQYPGNGYAENKCLTCHSTTVLATNKSCTAAGCHTASGVTSLANHGYDAAKHTPTAFTRAAQGTGADGTVDDGGLECNVCHTAGLTVAHSEAPAVGCDSGGAGGNGCHLDTTYNTMAVAKAGWPVEKCTDCHDYGVKRTHDDTATPHLVASNGCAGSASGCHPSNDLWRVHAYAQNGGVKKYNGCSNVDGTDAYGCHNVKDDRPTVNVANACGSTSTGCHRDISLGTHPSGYSHGFSATSYYSGASETGCTNQAGCHNVGGASTADFGGAYHPNAGCSTGDCHQSASKPAFTGLLPTDCQECHGGAFAGAPSRNTLTAAPGLGGHYNETTHTASGTTMTASVTAGGSAGATCTNCHSATVGGTSNGLLNQHTSVVIAGSPYGSAVGCGECHGDTRAYGAIEASAPANWTNNRCEDCHKAGGSSIFDHALSAPAVNGTSAASCGGTGTNCHTTYDLHSLHKNASGGCNLTGCHVYTQQSQRPSEKRCGEAGGCHAAYTVNSHAHATDAAKHQPTTSTQASDTAFAATACGACHDIRISNSSLTLEHALATSAKTTDATNNCRNCHNNAAATTAVGNSWSAKDSTSACLACHTGGLAIHATQNSTAHADVTSAGCGNSGTGCHNTHDLSQVGATNAVNTNIHADCLTCHDRTASGGNVAYDPTKDTCGSGRECHATAGQYNTTTYAHNGAGGLADGNDTSHHQSLIDRAEYTGGDLVYDGSQQCADCHSDTMTPSHANSSAGSVNCAGCHNSAVLTGADDVVKASWPTRKCTACHAIANVHTTYQTGAGLNAAHQASTTQGCSSGGAGCHGSSTDMGVIHAVAGCGAGNGTTNLTCHNVDKKMNTVGKSCGNGGVCHTAYSTADHNGISTANESASHETTLTGFVSDATGGTFTAAGNTCVSCHSRGLSTAHKDTSTTASLKSGNTGWNSTAASQCLDCHNTSSPDNATMVIKTDDWSARTCDQCHATGVGNRGNGYHDRYTLAEHTAGVGTSGTADGCTGACHGTQSDVRAIHDRVTSGCTVTGTDSQGWSGGCHALDKPMPATAMSCGSGGSGTNCHASHTNSNHGSATAHTFSTASNYSAATEAGCTNSGDGCHGTETGYGNYSSTYHPDSGCAAGPCHTSASKPSQTGDGGDECVECHNGTYVNAPDRTALQDAFPAGHYNETTHTASGTTMTVAVNAGGAASATCSQCHSATVGGLANGLLNQHSNTSVSGSSYGPAVGCGECHNDTRSFGAIEASSVTNWTSNKCEDCHKLGGTSVFDHGATAPAVNGTSTKSCGATGVNCHVTYDLHALHKDAAGGCNLSGCHVYTSQANKPSEKRCGESGGCHATYTVAQAFPTHTNGVSLETTAHAPTNTSQEIATWSVGGTTYQCGVCHLVSPADGGLSAEHTLAASARTTDAANNCRNCHNNAASTTAVTGDWAAKNTNTACAACHTGGLAIHANENTGAHTSANAGCSTAGTSPGCHNTQDLSSTGTTATAANTVIHNSCARCHDHAGAASWSSAQIGTAGSVKYNPSVKSCGGASGCHTSGSYSTTTYQHRIGRADVVNGTDAAHTAAGMGSTITSGVASAACSACHSSTLGAAHTTATVTNNLGSGHTAWSASTCLPCHNATVAPTANAATQVKGHWTNNLCSDCHSPSYHNTFATGHGATGVGCASTGSGCHNTADLAQLHGQTKTNGCQLSGCHDAANKGMQSATKTCGSTSGGCHNTYTDTNHGTITGGDTTHTASAMNTVLDATYNAGGANTCDVCHSSALESAHTTITADLAAPAWTTPMCAECHGGDTSPVTGAVSVIKSTGWPAKACDECHGGANGPAKHSEYTTGHSGTHAGWTCSTVGCHDTTDLRVVHNNTVTSNGSTAGCDSAGCHDTREKDMQLAAKSCGQGNTCHTDKTDSNHAISSGGKSCYLCHGTYQTSMEDGSGSKTGATRTSSYHHVLGGAAGDGDATFTAAAYPTSATDVYCLSCHVDHDKFNANKGANLRTDIAQASATGTNTDFIGSGTYGICVTCHSVSRAKDMANQKPGAGSENVPVISGAQYVNGAHQYSVTTTFGTSPFRADCVKCHDDEQTTAYQTGNSFSLHWSAEKRLIAALGATIQANDEAQENLCFKCHTGAAAGTDGYGVRAMTQASRRVQTVFGKASKHPVVAVGGASVECQSCHNTHLSTSLTETVDPNNTYNRLPYVTKSDTITFCLRCHDGNTPSKQVDGTTYVPADVTIDAGDATVMNKTSFAARGHWTANGSISSGEIAACADCHDQHGSDAPKLLGVYDPVANTNKIGAQTLTANDKTVCYGCHSAASTGYPNLASTSATGYPIDGRWPGSTVWNTAHNATSHTGNAHQKNTVTWPGAAQTAGDCKNCHDVHGTANSFDALRGAAGSYAPGTMTFCFTCHDGTVVATKNIKQYYPATAGGTSVDANAGHIIQTPTGLLPAGSGMPCYSCHNVHGSGAAWGLQVVTMSGGTTITVGDSAGEINMDPSTRTAADIRRYCFTCHGTSDATAQGWNGASMVAITSGSVLGIDRTTYDTTNKRGLKLPSTTAEHAAAGTASCYTCHGNDYSGATTNNVHAPSPGVSAGGQACYNCHNTYQTAMEDNAGTKTGATRTSSYHHVLGNGATWDGDNAFAQGSYPAAGVNVACLSCHVDHSLFNSNKGANLRTNANATAVATNNDFSGTSGVCVACHTTSMAKDTANQKTPTQTQTPVINGTNYSTSAHQYAVSSSFGASAFNANCSKCHSDSTAVQYQTSATKFATHWSTEQHLLQSLGAALQVNDEAHENHCYECHSTDNNPYGGSGKDGHNVASMTTTATAIKGMFQLSSRHPIESDNVYCQNCHNVHIQTTTTETADPDNTYNKINWTSAAEQATYCLKCHDGTPPTALVNGTTYIPQTVTIDATDTTRVNKSTNAARGHWTANGSISAGETKGCGTCHDNHGSVAPKLLGFRDVGTASNRINGIAITANDYTVCGACHTSFSTGYPNGASHTASGYPSDGTWPGVTQYNNATTGIHRVGRANVVYPGTTYAAGDCKNCHDVHGTANTLDELRGTYSSSSFATCFECHDGSPSTIDIKQFFPVAAGGTSSDSRSGHRTINAGLLPAGAAVPCYSCHNPHGSSSPDGLQVITQIAANTTVTVGGSANPFDLSTAAGVRRFCFTCHTTDDNNNGWNGTAYAAVVSGAKVLGIDRIDTTKRLNLPTTSGHNSADTGSCYTCHGNSYAAGGNNVHQPGAGGGSGGSACNTAGCHTTYTVMANDTTTFHHVLDNATPYQAPAAGNTYPTSDNLLACVSCHTDHNNFSSNKAANLRVSIDSNSGAPASATDSDFIASGAYGICMSCHDVAQTKNATGQKVGGSTQTPAMSGANYGASSHNYEINNSASVGFGTNAFKANCSKCHDDEQDAANKMSSTYKIGTHYSAEARLVKALGVTLVGTNHAEENGCYRCHTGAGAGNDGYGTQAMSARARNIQTAFGKAYKHNVAGYAGIHKNDEYNAAPATIGQGTASAGWYGTGNANRHVECADCHNVHEAGNPSNNMTNDNAAARTSTLPTISAANKGAWGVTITGGTGGDWAGSNTIGGGAPAGPTYNKSATASYEWQLCLKCHSRYAWGNQTVPNVPSAGTNSAVSVMTDVGKDFDPANYAYHPLFRQGLNQPPTTANGLWNSSAGRRNISGTTSGNGLSNTFVDGWLSTSRVTCTDCHGNNDWTATAARGPHGSGQKWLLRGANTGVKVTIAAGTVVNINTGTLTTSICQNCHRADVYGNGSGGDAPTTMYGTLGRVDHPGDFGSCDSNSYVTQIGSGCNNCHGGRPSGTGAGSPNGLIHGSAAGVGVDGGDPIGKRFTNGASWDSHWLAQSSGSVGCSTINAGDNYSSCSKHTGANAKTFTPQYYY